MNVEIIRETLTLARVVVLDSLIARHELREVRRESELLRFASELAEHYSDCKALVAIDRALKALPGAGEPAAGESEAGR